MPPEDWRLTATLRVIRLKEKLRNNMAKSGHTDAVPRQAKLGALLRPGAADYLRWSPWLLAEASVSYPPSQCD